MKKEMINQYELLERSQRTHLHETLEKKISKFLPSKKFEENHASNCNFSRYKQFFLGATLISALITSACQEPTITYKQIPDHSTGKQKQTMEVDSWSDVYDFMRSDVKKKYHSAKKNIEEKVLDRNTMDSLIRRMKKEKEEKTYQFIDTKKPNALIAMCEYDPEDVLSSKYLKIFYLTLNKTYDCCYVNVDDEDDLTYALDKLSDYTKDSLDLFMVVGHGEQRRIKLGNGYFEHNYLDCNDYDMTSSLRRLKKDATIALISCSTGKGGDEEQNLANFIAAISDRKVISSKSDFSPYEIYINSTPPINIKIIDYDTGENYTYIPGKKNRSTMLEKLRKY